MASDADAASVVYAKGRLDMAKEWWGKKPDYESKAGWRDIKVVAAIFLIPIAVYVASLAWASYDLRHGNVQPRPMATAIAVSIAPEIEKIPKEVRTSPGCDWSAQPRTMPQSVVKCLSVRRWLDGCKWWMFEDCEGASVDETILRFPNVLGAAIDGLRRPCDFLTATYNEALFPERAWRITGELNLSLYQSEQKASGCLENESRIPKRRLLAVIGESGDPVFTIEVDD